MNSKGHHLVCTIADNDEWHRLPCTHTASCSWFSSSYMIDTIHSPSTTPCSFLAMWAPSLLHPPGIHFPQRNPTVLQTPAAISRRKICAVWQRTYLDVGWVLKPWQDDRCENIMISCFDNSLIPLESCLLAPCNPAAQQLHRSGHHLCTNTTSATIINPRHHSFQ